MFDKRPMLNLAAFRSDDKAYEANQSILVETATGPIAR